MKTNRHSVPVKSVKAVVPIGHPMSPAEFQERLTRQRADESGRVRRDTELLKKLLILAREGFWPPRTIEADRFNVSTVQVFNA